MPRVGQKPSENDSHFNEESSTGQNVIAEYFKTRPALMGFLSLFAVMAGTAAGLTLTYFEDYPPVASLNVYRPNVVTKILASNGEIISELYQEKRIVVPIARVPQTMINAIVAAEDDQFFKHSGMDYPGVIRALVKDIIAGKVVQGGSTITQQLAKVMFLTSERSFRRKLYEALIALDIERKYTKPEIMELYLNHIYFGSGAFGVEAAAEVYFGKSVSELNLEESALIAGLPKAPSKYSPLVNLPKATNRRNFVLGRMASEGFITQEEMELARNRPVRLAHHDLAERVAPHFVELVRQRLEQKFEPNILYREGFTVYTTLDLDYQRAANDAMEIGLAEINHRNNVKDEPIDGALVAIDSRTGFVRAMVGGADFETSQFNKAVQARRQPGSAFKPFIYLTAIEQGGYVPSDIVYDSPVEYRGSSAAAVWKPTNYDEKFRGPVTLRAALENSINIPAIKLLEKVGISNVISTAQKLGVKGKFSPFLSLGLGAAEVTLLDITSAYGALGAGGLLAEPKLIERIESRDGKIIEQVTPVVTEAISPEAAYIVTDMLEGVLINGTARNIGNIGRPAAGKTGTTTDYRDAWFVGYTPSLSAGVWIGYENNSEMKRSETGGHAAAPIWRDFMTAALKDVKPEQFDIPAGVSVVEIDPATGMKATSSCPSMRAEVFLKGSEPREYCASHSGSHSALTPQAPLDTRL